MRWDQQAYGWTFQRADPSLLLTVDKWNTGQIIVSRGLGSRLLLIAALSFAGCGEVRKGETLSCNGELENLTLVYNTTLAADGSRFVNCELWDASASYGHSEQYLAGRLGAKDGGCTLRYDLDDPTGGYWSFSMETLSAEYKDRSSPWDGTVVAFPEASCTH